MDAEKSKQLKAQLELMADKALLRELITHEFTVRHIQQIITTLVKYTSRAATLPPYLRV